MKSLKEIAIHIISSNSKIYKYSKLGNNEIEELIPALCKEDSLTVFKLQIIFKNRINYL